jgi:hypothetical protein
MFNIFNSPLDVIVAPSQSGPQPEMNTRKVTKGMADGSS